MFKLKNRRHKRLANLKGASSPSYNYYSNRGVEQKKPSKARTKNQKTSIKHFLVHLPIYIAILAILICFGYILTLSTTPKIIVFNQSGLSSLRPNDEYSNATKKLLSSSVVNLTKITINSQIIESNLKNQYPELAKVAVTLPIIGRRPVVKLEIATPILILNTNNKDYVLNREGRSIIEASDAQKKALEDLPIITDKSSLEIKLGDKVLTTDEVTFITEIFAQFRAKKILISSLILPQLPSEIQVKVKGQPYFVKFDLLGNSKTQLGSFFAVKRRLEARKIAPSKYIDVRVEGKVYYK